MLHEIVPGRQRSVNIFCVRVRKRPQPQIPVVGVEVVELKFEIGLVRFHHRRVFEPIAQPERAVVMKVVTQKHVRRRSLLRNGSQRRMRLQHPHHRQPPAVRNPQEPHAPIVSRDIFHQPVDCVVGIRALVDCLRILRIAHGSIHHELPL